MIFREELFLQKTFYLEECLFLSDREVRISFRILDFLLSGYMLLSGVLLGFYSLPLVYSLCSRMLEYA